MPHQEHLPQAGRGLAHRGRVPGPAAWLAALIALWLCWLAAPASAAEAEPVVWLERAEAARGSGWDDTAPPESGWMPVTLPDHWDKRWRTFDGVVWYRLSWEQSGPLVPQGLLMRHLTMAGEVILNGSPISRDASLVEPLSRSWNTPRYWLLSPPLLREGRNTLLVRVSGVAAYQPGLGAFALGPPAEVRALYDSERLVRHDLQIVGLAVSFTLGAFFGTLWLMRRGEAAYGWFALTVVLWLAFGVNQVVTSPWPFASIDGWQAANTAILLAFIVAFSMYTLRFCGQRLPRLESCLIALACFGAIDLWLATPEQMAWRRLGWTLVASATLFSVCFHYLWRALRQGNLEQRALMPLMAVVVGSVAHDLMVFTKVLDSNTYYAVISSYLPLLGMALALAWRFVTSLGRIENFNTQLVAEVEAAKAELGATLAQQHQLEVAHARIGERINFASDLHDGLGGMLVGSIATLEHSPERLSAPELLAMLKSLRDDLRLIIDAAGTQGSTQTLGELLVPLRHRLTQLLEANGIACRWRVTGVESLTLSPSRSLDALRLLQEALTNVLKHSGARQAEVAVHYDGQALALQVRDDGRGFAPASAGSGAGLRSMRARARRLGGELQLQSRPGDTQVALRVAPAADTA